VHALRHSLGLDKPLWEQYFLWVGDLLHGNLGKSLLLQDAITHDISQRIGWTFELGAFALFFSMLVSLPVGILSAIKQDSIWDFLARSTAIGALAIPSFWLATLLPVGVHAEGFGGALIGALTVSIVSFIASRFLK